MEIKEQPNQPAKPPTFLQIVRSPVTYALIVVVSMAWAVIFYITHRSDSQLDREARLYDNQLDRESRLYERLLEESRRQNKEEITNQIKPIAEKVDTIKQKADSTFKNINDKLP